MVIGRTKNLYVNDGTILVDDELNAYTSLNILLLTDCRILDILVQPSIDITGEFCTLLGNIQDAVIINLFHNRSGRAGNNSRGSACTYNSNNALVYFFRCLDFFLRNFHFILHDIQHIRSSRNGLWWGSSHRLLLLRDRNHVILNNHIIHFFCALINLNLTLSPLKRNEDCCEHKYIANQKTGPRLTFELVVKVSFFYVFHIDFC